MTDEATPIAPLPTDSEDEATMLPRLSKTTAEAYERGFIAGHTRATEAAEKDAARYRYVRSVRPDVLLNVAWSMSSEACKIGADADAAIDAAITAKSGS